MPKYNLNKKKWTKAVLLILALLFGLSYVVALITSVLSF